MDEEGGGEDGVRVNNDVLAMPLPAAAVSDINDISSTDTSSSDNYDTISEGRKYSIKLVTIVIITIIITTIIVVISITIITIIVLTITITTSLNIRST
jgi:hypothetical protein